MAEAESEIPRKVALFSGHMIDRSDRKAPRFPPGREPIAAAAIAKALADLDIGASDLAICGGACGGDLLFADAALARAARLEIYIPFEEPQFLANSVEFADGFADPPWTARFEGAKARGSLHIAARELGPTVAGEDPYGRKISGCSTPPRVSARKSSTSSVCGMGRAATMRAGRAICGTRSGNAAAARSGSRSRSCDRRRECPLRSAGRPVKEAI
jgi:hypothetical protein